MPSTPPHPPDPPPAGTTDRRRFLAGAGVAIGSAGAAWIAPEIVSRTAASAQSPAGPVDLVAVGQVSPDQAVAVAWSSSTAGVTWAAATISGSRALGVATDGAGTWVAVGTGAVWTSVDGSTWVPSVSSSPPSPPFGYDGRAVATDGAGRWVSVGESSFPVYRSDAPGSIWTAATTQPSGTLVVEGVATDAIGPDPTWVAVGPNGAYLSTDSGDTWATITTPVGWDAVSVATDGAGRWVAVGPAGAWTWTGTGSWIASSTPPASWATSVATDGAGRWVAVGHDGSETLGRAWFSTDHGDTWTAATTPPTDPVNGVATSGSGAWATVGNGFSGGGSWTSPDGDVWTQSPTPLKDGAARSVAFDRLLP